MNITRRINLLVLMMMLICGGQLSAQQKMRKSYSQPNENELDSTELAQIKMQYQSAELISSNETPRLYLIERVNIHGVKNINHNIIRSSAGLIEGDSILLPGERISVAIGRLWSQRLYGDIEVGAHIEGDRVTIDLFLEERPRVLNWNVEGVSRSRIRDIKDELNLRRNTELSEYVIDKNSKAIKSYMSTKGHRNSDVSLRIENDSVREHMVNVTFVVEPNEKQKIGEIIFDGNEAFEDKRLRRTFKGTHQKSWNFFQSKRLKEDKYKEDKENLIEFYNANGYRNAVILTDSIYDIDEKHIGIKVKVAEGEKYYIRNISWVGNSLYPTERLEQMFGVQSGDTYDRKSMHKRLGVGRENNPQESSVSSLYQNEGYLTSRIEPAEIIVGTDSIDLEIKIFEGKQFTVNDVKLSGNIRLDDEVIRRELYTRPGEVYNQALLMQTLQLLSSMGHFNPENLAPNIQPISNELVDIGFDLEETASDQVNISGGWGNNSFIGSIGLTLNNLAIKDFFKKGAWRPYPMGQNQRLSISGQTNGTYYKSAAVSFTDPWFGGKKANSFTVSTHYSDQNNAYYIYQKPTKFFRTIGAAAGLGQRLTFPDPYFTIYNELSYMQYRLKDWTYGGTTLFSDGTGISHMISFRTVLSRSSVDQPIYPRRGSDISLTLQLTPPLSLFDGVDYSDSDLTDKERYKWVEFHKWNANATWYQALSPNQNLVLMLRAQMGYIGYYNEYRQSPFELFDVGGDGLTGYSMYGVDIISLRGYEDSALNPATGGYARAFNKYTMELRYPVVLEPSSQIYVLGFVEGGNGFDSWKSFSPFNIKRSAGFGVRLNLPMVGMLGFDWGYGFDPANGYSTKSGSQFHFILGQQF